MKKFFSIFLCFFFFEIAFSRDYYVCFQSFLDKGLSAQANSQYCAAGVQTQVYLFSTKDGKLFHRIAFVHPYSTRKEAEEQLQKFRRDLAGTGLDLSTSWICVDLGERADISTTSRSEPASSHQKVAGDGSEKYRTPEKPYSVLVMRYGDFDSAAKKEKELDALGYSSYIEISPDRQVFAVHVGAYATEGEAQSKLSNMSQNGFFNLNVSKFNLEEHYVVSPHYSQSPVGPYEIKFPRFQIVDEEAQNSEKTETAAKSAAAETSKNDEFAETPKKAESPKAESSAKASEPDKSGALNSFLAQFFHDVPNPKESEFSVSKFVVFDKTKSTGEKDTAAAVAELPAFLASENFESFAQATYQGKDTEKIANVAVCGFSQDALTSFLDSKADEILTANGEVSEKSLSYATSKGENKTMSCKVSQGERTLLLGKIDDKTLFAIDAQNFSDADFESFMKNTLNF